MLIILSTFSTTFAQDTLRSDDQPQMQVFLPLVTNHSESNATEVNAQTDIQVSANDQTTAEAAAVAPTIRLNGQMAPLFGIRTNSNHGWITDRCGFVAGQNEPANCGNAKSYGAWIDGPLNPYRYAGNTYFQIPHSENYRIKIPNNNWGNNKSWVMEGDTLPSGRSATESFYNNRHWLFAVRNVNGTLYGLTHHEWYKDRLTVGGVQGFLASDWWITAIGWAQSTNGGAAWQMKPTSDGSRRLIIVPQPSDWTPIRKTYGFAHPSNIVWDTKSQRYYVFTSSYNYTSTGAFAGGVALLRAKTINQPTGWEFWNGSGWTGVNHNTYQGNFGPQMPYLFWRDPNSGNGTGCSHLYAMNVRRHKFSGKWIVLGSKWCTAQAPNWEATFSWTIDLAKPTDLERNLSKVINPPGQAIIGRPYYSFFDTDGSADDNYQEIGNNPLFVSVTEDRGQYYQQSLTLTGF